MGALALATQRGERNMHLKRLLAVDWTNKHDWLIDYALGAVITILTTSLILALECI